MTADEMDARAAAYRVAAEALDDEGQTKAAEWLTDEADNLEVWASHERRAAMIVEHQP